MFVNETIREQLKSSDGVLDYSFFKWNDLYYYGCAMKDTNFYKSLHLLNEDYTGVQKIMRIPLMPITNSIRWRSLRSEATLQFKCITYPPYFPIY